MESVALTHDEIRICRQIFDKHDINKNGSVSIVQIKAALTAIGQSMTDEDMYLMLSEAHADHNGLIGFQEYLRVIEQQKMTTMQSKDTQATIDAFVALGGNPDMTGKVSLQKLRSALQEFGLLQNVNLVDKDGSELIDFEEFKSIVD